MPRIAAPRDLTRAIRSVREAMDAGVLAESDYWPKGQPRFTSVPFSRLSESGGWEDIVQYYFQCTSCGQRFRLVAETYRGSGGELSPDDDPA